MSNAIGIVMSSVSATRINQITTNFHNGICISVAKIHGTSAEKNIIADTLVIAMTKRTSSAAFTTSSDGKTFLSVISSRLWL